MAIGDVQNRFNYGGQEINGSQATRNNRGQAGQNRIEPQQQENNLRKNNLTPKRNESQVNSQETPGGIARKERSGIQKRDFADLQNRRQNSVNTDRPQNNRIEKKESTNVLRRTEQSALFRRREQNPINAVNKRRKNPADKGVQRSQKSQIQRIQNQNSGQANAPRSVQSERLVLSQENQTGARLDITG
ncbi:hypothetical protein ACFL67_02380 [candidate division KSB1 bacterium]